MHLASFSCICFFLRDKDLVSSSMVDVDDTRDGFLCRDVLSSVLGRALPRFLLAVELFGFITFDRDADRCIGW